MELTIIINFHNMRRQAERTLFTLSRTFQRDCADIAYNVVTIDHGSSEKLDADRVRGAGENVRYLYLDTDAVSPCRALNAAVEDAQSEFVLIAIDGARMFSPGVIAQCRAAADRHDHPFAFCLNAHLGVDKQYRLAEKGHSQADEDALLATVDWRADGYRLFDIACLGNLMAHDHGPNESNVLFLKKADFLSVGGYDPAFASPGGGFAGIDLFRRLVGSATIDPVLLIGEATFHQMHGGTVTETYGEPRKARIAAMAEEYAEITGAPSKRAYYPFDRLGERHDRWRRFIEREGRR
ncbi:MAG: glycosyltransferase family 2 protein [Pseudomonadota bacterium]